MSRTYGGRIFRCKGCYGKHLIPYDTFEDNPEEKVTVSIECPVDHKIYNYPAEAFKRWVGLYWTYLDNVLKPISVEKEQPKKNQEKR